MTPNVLAKLLPCLAGVVVSLQPLHAADRTNPPPPQVRREAPRAPVFELPNLDGQLVSVTTFRQPILIVMFWATWDRPSQRQVAVLTNLRQEIGTNHVEVIGISVDTNDVAQIKEFLTNNEIQFPVVKYDSKVVDGFGGITSIPTLFVIDRNRNIYQRYVGYTTPAILKADVELLRKPYATGP